MRRSAKLTAKVRPKRDRRRPFRFTTTGRLSFSSAVSQAKGCKGSVTVRFKAGTKTISSRRTQIKSTCRYSSRVTFKNKRRFNKRRNLRVLVRFAGNAVLKPDSAKTVTVRVG